MSRDVSAEDFENASTELPIPKDPKAELLKAVDEQVIIDVSEAMKQPLDFQRALAAKVKISLDNLMKRDFDKQGFYGDFTMRCINNYAGLLDAIHKNTHGEKITTRNYHMLTHADIGANLRRMTEDDKN